MAWVYVGSGLGPSARIGGAWGPALLVPDPKVSWTRPDHEGRRMGYWPSYSGDRSGVPGGISHWLASGRKEPAAYIGYVFLFFYGIERRVLVDAQTSLGQGRDRRAAREVERLLAIYGETVRSAATRAPFRHRPSSASSLDPAALKPPRAGTAGRSRFREDRSGRLFG